jgi:hypothetical protein
MHPEDLMSLIREDDAEAQAYLSSLPVAERRTKARAGAKPWRPLLVKSQIIKKWAAEIEANTCPHCGQVIPSVRKPTRLQVDLDTRGVPHTESGTMELPDGTTSARVMGYPKGVRS